MGRLNIEALRKMATKERERLHQHAVNFYPESLVLTPNQKANLARWDRKIESYPSGSARFQEEMKLLKAGPTPPTLS